MPPCDARSLAQALAGVLGGTTALLPGGTGGAGSDVDDGRGHWLDAAAGRASQHSMGRLAEWYEGIYQSAVVGHGG